MSHTWTMRDYREGDEEGILGLRQRVFGDLDPVRLMPETWRWQFCENPAGEPLIALAEDQGRIVGQYAVIPTRFRVQGREVSLALSCDTMIDPAYQRRGLFTALARRVYGRMESDGRMEAVWGFPNEASLPGFTRRLDWRLVTVFPLRVAPLRPLALLGSVFGLKKARRGGFPPVTGPAPPVSAAVAGLEVASVGRFDEAFDDLWKRQRGLAPVIQVRDAAYLNWRYAGVPAFGYRVFAVRSSGRLLGYMVIRCMSLMGHFVGVLTDIFPFPVRDPLTTKCLFRFAQDYCRDQGAEFMTCLLSQGDSAFFREVGLRTVPAVLNPRQWCLAGRFGPPDAGTLGDARQWYVTYGDTDVV